MIRPQLMPSLLALSLGLMSSPLWAADKPLLQAGKKTLYQRVLTTPSCQLTDSPAPQQGKAQPAFTRFYVYQRQGSGAEEWLQVGPDSYGKTVGWIKASCAVDWKMQMTLALTNPAGRDPLLFFKDEATVEKVFGAKDPATLLKPIRANLSSKGQDPNVLAREPDYAVDLDKNFYLLPVLEAKEIFTEKGFQVRVLNVASVTAKDKDNPAKTSAKQEQHMLKGFSAAVVFVIDSTISMGPYIDRTREAVRKVYQQIEQEKLGDQVRFGLVAFRSNTKEVPALEYVSKLFVDPSKVKGGDDFLNKVSSLKQASVSSPRFDEDAYAGVMQALDQVDWNNFGARYVVLITDAGALAGDDPLSSTGLNADQVRLEAQYRGVAIYGLHLKTPSGAKNHDTAEAQYRDLTQNAYLNKPLYYPVNAGDVNEFGQKVDALAEAITAQVKAAYKGDMAAGSALGADANYAKADDKGKKDPLLKDAELLGHAMRLAYLGEVSGSSAPPVFKAWISDRDPVRQNVPTTDVRVLLTKGQLSDLSDVVKQIADAANQGLISPSDMFERLRSVAATMGQDPNQLKQNSKASLGQMGLMAEYLEGLPYKSEVLSLDEETWKGMEGLEQEKFIRRLNTKLKYYQRYNADVDRWVSLAQGSDPRDHVYPVPLEALP